MINSILYQNVSRSKQFFRIFSRLIPHCKACVRATAKTFASINTGLAFTGKLFVRKISLSPLLFHFTTNDTFSSNSSTECDFIAAFIQPRRIFISFWLSISSMLYRCSLESSVHMSIIFACPYRFLVLFYGTTLVTFNSKIPVNIRRASCSTN